jgi:hypothetical protein
MSLALAQAHYEWRDIIEAIVTEDDEPVDNLFSEKQQTLLKRSLYASWTPPAEEKKKSKQPRKFLAAANVGVFFAVHEAPLVPDFFLSLDVEPHQNWYAKEHRSYFVWEFGKVPELVLEIVSNRKGKELTAKLKDYARMGVQYYVVFDPQAQIGKEPLCVYELGFGKRYRPRKDYAMPDLNLSLTLWHGVFEGHEDNWLRWCDAGGQLIATGEERAANAEAELEKLRAEVARLKQKSLK